MNWDKIVQKVTPYIFKVETPLGSGTGFFYLLNDTKTFCGVATALHVVSYAEDWRQPIRLIHFQSNNSLFLNAQEYIIFSSPTMDAAVIFFRKPIFELPSEVIELLPLDTPLSIGNEVGWLGFPTIEPNSLCFFSGNISAWQQFRKAYLIDGVAINGVSGGPVIFADVTDGIQIVGIVSAYRTNRAGGDVLPGLLYAQDVSHFHGVLQKVQSIDDANKKKKEIEKQQVNKGIPTQTQTETQANEVPKN